MKTQLLGAVGVNWVASIFIAIELSLAIKQLFRCIEWPKEKKELWHFFLLTSLLTYNVTCGLFPNNNLNLSLAIQYALRYCSILLVTAYCTFYFYNVFAFTKLKFQIKYCLTAFLLAPYVLSFIIGSFFTDDLLLLLKMSTLIPTVYTLILVFIVGKNVFEKHKKESLNSLNEVLLLYLALLMWAVTTFLITADVGKFHELILANTAFLFFFIFSIKKQFQRNKQRDALFESMANELAHLRSMVDTSVKTVSETNTPTTRQNGSIFDQNCRKHLTSAQAEIVKQVNQGVKYSKIAELRNVSEDYIKGVMSEIGKRLEVKGRENVLKKLKSRN